MIVISAAESTARDNLFTSATEMQKPLHAMLRGLLGAALTGAE